MSATFGPALYSATGAATHSWGGGGFGFGPLGFLLIIALVGVGVWYAARGTWPWQRPPVDRARDILLERYARGEITKEEYRERLEQMP